MWVILWCYWHVCSFSGLFVLLLRAILWMVFFAVHFGEVHCQIVLVFFSCYLKNCALVWMERHDDMSQSFPHFAADVRSSCNLCVSSLFRIVLYIIQSSANNLRVMCWMYSLKSFTYIRNRIGSKAVHWWIPDIKWIVRSIVYYIVFITVFKDRTDIRVFHVHWNFTCV